MGKIEFFRFPLFPPASHEVFDSLTQALTGSELMKGIPYAAPLVVGTAGLPVGAIHAPAAARNSEPIAHALRALLTSDAVGASAPAAVLELACGSGQHANELCASLAPLIESWQPTDKEPSACASCEAYRLAQPEGSPARARLLPARVLCVEDNPWPPHFANATFDLVLCVNLLHIAPPTAGPAALRGAAGALRAGGLLCVYGPFLQNGEPTTPSNAAFNAQLQQMNPAFGLRDIDREVFAPGKALGLAKHSVISMPANNFLLVLQKEG